MTPGEALAAYERALEAERLAQGDVVAARTWARDELEALT